MKGRIFTFPTYQIDTNKCRFSFTDRQELFGPQNKEREQKVKTLNVRTLERTFRDLSQVRRDGDTFRLSRETTSSFRLLVLRNMRSSGSVSTTTDHQKSDRWEEVNTDDTCGRGIENRTFDSSFDIERQNEKKRVDGKLETKRNLFYK